MKRASQLRCITKNERCDVPGVNKQSVRQTERVRWKKIAQRNKKIIDALKLLQVPVLKHSRNWLNLSLNNKYTREKNTFWDLITSICGHTNSSQTLSSLNAMLLMAVSILLQTTVSRSRHIRTRLLRTWALLADPVQFKKFWRVEMHVWPPERHVMLSCTCDSFGQPCYGVSALLETRRANLFQASHR